MKYIQGKKTIGYIVLAIEGGHIEQFLDHCVNKDIPIWNVEQYKNNQKYQFTTYLHHYKKIKLINDNLIKPYKIKVIKKRGLSAFLSRLFQKKQILVSILISCLTLFILSNVIWSINIKGVSLEIEEKIMDELADNGVTVGSFSFSLSSVQSLQQNMINNIPELLWIGIEKKGASFHVEGVEKKIVKDEPPVTPQHLIAKKNGIIEHMYIRQGLPLVNKNDYVKKGDLLVSGIIKPDDELEEEDDEDKEESEDIEPIEAKGEVFANTWYEIKMTIPLETNYATLTGESKKFYKLKIGRFLLPVWGIRRANFENIYEERTEESLYFLKWKLPLNIVSETHHQLKDRIVKRSKNDAVNLGIEQVQENLKRELGEDAKILSNYTLHEAVDSGKVNLNLYVSVLENIALEQRIK